MKKISLPHLIRLAIDSGRKVVQNQKALWRNGGGKKETEREFQAEEEEEEEKE